MTGKLKRILYRLRLFFNPYNVVIKGECLRCGECCRNLILFIRGRTIQTEEEFESEKLKHPEYDMFDIRSVNDDGDLIFECTNLGADNRCSIHTGRPKMCRTYPSKKMIANGGRLLEGCGYRVCEMISFREIMPPEEDRK